MLQRWIRKKCFLVVFSVIFIVSRKRHVPGPGSSSLRELRWRKTDCMSHTLVEIKRPDWNLTLWQKIFGSVWGNGSFVVCHWELWWLPLAVVCCSLTSQLVAASLLTKQWNFWHSDIEGSCRWWTKFIWNDGNYLCVSLENLVWKFRKCWLVTSISSFPTMLFPQLVETWIVS